MAEDLARMPPRYREPLPASWNPDVAEGRIVPGSGNHPETTRPADGPLPPPQWHNRESTRGAHGTYVEERTSVLKQRQNDWWNAMQPAPPARAHESRPLVQTSFSASGACGSSRPLMRTRAPHKTPPKRPGEEEPRTRSPESLMRARKRRADRLCAEALPEAPAPEAQPQATFLNCVGSSRHGIHGLIGPAKPALNSTYHIGMSEEID